ncbi:Threonine/homoserine/homoserine lactone efflux protein [Marinobacter antarcticus]|uniref:Threonine/homoserine/homoserine lactone efflux protein n=1 Tax=Marinobacter antarcticus TaxID=564117 RepID=A0A1M6VGR9_9GAMM|nr:LysE family translocator [Marinobacter antarcticus]SHK80535.1 Threonine/homoserine/homoserine lactone efflux protein [Marinobacter antarcticus]
MFTDLFWAYLIAISLLTVTPGVDTLLVMRNAGRGGFRDGCVTSAGICSGLFIHATLSALGISLLLLETAWAFSALKWAGACYLIWLGLGSLRQAINRGPALSPESPSVARRCVPLTVSFREGLLSNVLNPKTALFYMALLPQFVDPSGSAFLQSLMLAGVHFLLAMFWQCGLAWMVVRFRGVGVGVRVKRLLNGLTGGFFIAMGAKLAVN